MSTVSSWEPLNDAIAGELVLPGSPAYETARLPAIARFHDTRPAAVVRCAAPADVAETIRFARLSGVSAVPRSGGHCFAGHSSTEGIIIDVTPMGSVSVSSGTATVGAGARLDAVYDALERHDLTIPGGCGPTVGIAGLTLGGGLGILGRVFGAMLGSQADTTMLLEELVVRAGADPTSTVLGHRSYRATKRHLAEHGPGEERPGAHPYSKSEFFPRPLPTDAVAALLEHFNAGRVAGQSRELDFTPWGGAYNRVPADATAFVHRDARFLLKQAAMVGPDANGAQRRAARSWLAESWALVHPWGTGGAYQNFPDPDLDDWAHAYYGDNLDRLVRVKARYDPGDFFRFAQSLRAGGE
jgi:hypothetical protein